MLKPRAYLIQSEKHEAVTLEKERAVDYAARQHGIVRHLVLRDEALELQAALEAIQTLVESPDAARNIPLIRAACERALKT
jgi:hypothetical protein